ncbi:Mitochondrial carrier protein [Colletotrichum higginsianum IMI 349063]|nr:Mitochondrial carrier protein [Colletotrichum higginsianum IMI 349063]OBR05344.1 Mitochondrial carrier protein [Colletotrichum higginsianum IMI 349063]
MPFDNIKTRMQSVNARYKGMLDCAAQTLREDGVLAFWRGTSPRLVRLTLSSGITFTVYDQVVRLIKSAQADRDATDLQRV